MVVDYKALKSGGFMRQKQKDRFSLRLKVVGGNLTAGQIRTIADMSQKYGDGHIHLTSRQGVEIPFIRLADVEKVKADLEAGGVFTGVCGPRVRTVTACQGSEICPSGCIDTYALAQAISRRYFGRELPHKFKFGVTGCQNNCLKAEENDLGVKGGCRVSWEEESCTFCGVCLKACREGALSLRDRKILLAADLCNNCGRCFQSCPAGAWKGEPGYLVSFGGMFGNRIARGRQILPLLQDTESLFRAADAALAFFDRHARPGERFRTAIDRAGWDAFAAAIQESRAAPEYRIDETLDITDVVCPVTFAKALAALEELEEGRVLSIRMNDGEPAQNVPRSLKDEGHQILRLVDNADGTCTLITRKVGG
ncbi:MAG: sulfurtransferase TusA family protein [Desulfovibrio sp.]|nr:sulfurtransferase TusA family protein [Desulfovibrio sp.]